MVCAAAARLAVTLQAARAVGGTPTLPRCSLLPSFENPRSTLLSTGLESWTLRLTRASLSRSRRRQLLFVLAFGFTIERLGAVVRRRELAWP